ncbi:MAG: hypothetical protein ACK4YV_06675, partial [Emticicia sp.]
MESQKPNNFEEEWKKAFNDASFAPPSDMWERIEQDLERKKRRPFLFFLRPSAMLAGVAATLILALGGILFFNKQESSNLGTAHTQTKNQPNLDTENSKNLAEKASDNIEETNAQIGERLASAETAVNKSVTNPKKLSRNNQLPTLAAVSFANLNTGNVLADAPMNINQSNIQTIDNQINTGIFLSQNDSKISTNLALLKPREYQYLGSRYTLNRNKLWFEAEEKETPIVASNDAKFWVGVQSGVSPFDPNMKLGGLNTVALAQADAFAKNSNTLSVGASPSVGDKGGNVMVSQPKNAIRSGIGINTGIAMGYKISKKWNFESGIRYLRGNSTLNSNTYAFQQNGYVNTFFADYLMQNS